MDGHAKRFSVAAREGSRQDSLLSKVAQSTESTKLTGRINGMETLGSDILAPTSSFTLFDSLVFLAPPPLCVRVVVFVVLFFQSFFASLAGGWLFRCAGRRVRGPRSPESHRWLPHALIEHLGVRGSRLLGNINKGHGKQYKMKSDLRSMR